MKIGYRFAGLSIKQKVQYIFIFAIALCVLFCFIFFYFFMQGSMTKSSIEKNANNISSIEQNFDSVIDSVNNISKLIMVNDVVTTYLKSDSTNPIYANAARSEIYNMLNSFSGHYSVFVFKNDTESIMTGIGIISGNKEIIYGKDWFGKVYALEGGYILFPNTGGAFTSNTDANVISFARIINDIDTQEPLGMLVINIPVSELEQTYMNLANEDNHFAYLDSEGNVICSDIDFEEFAVEDENGGIIDLHRGLFGDRVVTTSQETDSGLVIMCSSTVRIMEGMSIEIACSLLCILVITIIVMIFINAYINRYITVPISKLADSMHQADTGMLRRVSIQVNDDEIGMLKDSYNRMLIQINKLIEDLVEQEQIRQKAEMDALQEQIKPHFLYNTLDTIGYMSLQNSPGEVYDAIETLGNFYRKFLSKGSQTISLADEISIVKDYIKLQRLRYEDMFDDEYIIQNGIGTIMVPKLILQPLVENSIYHGIRPKGEKGIIRISAESENDCLTIKVYDSGVGMTEEEIEQLLRNGANSKSFGFKGTIDRIRYFYHEDNVVSIRSKEGEFCEVCITVPLK